MNAVVVRAGAEPGQQALVSYPRTESGDGLSGEDNPTTTTQNDVSSFITDRTTNALRFDSASLQLFENSEQFEVDVPRRLSVRDLLQKQGAKLRGSYSCPLSIKNDLGFQQERELLSSI